MATNSKKSSKNKQPVRELDTSNATKGVWLIKVPNYLSDVWREADPNSDLGMMKIGSYVRSVRVHHLHSYYGLLGLGVGMEGRAVYAL